MSPLTGRRRGRKRDARRRSGCRAGAAGGGRPRLARECGAQPEFGPELVNEIGYLEPVYKDEKIKGLKGTGLKFFYSQLITGDRVDNIPGLPKGGPVLAFNTLDACHTEEELFREVSALYLERVPNPQEYLLEQGQLLWMVQSLHEDGSPVMWEPKW